ncbi:MAG: hypothetical protein D6693_07655 [Planctomycetota bacterium]|nr:MAG: hypothetical protein D6693_07655 [Planctomycetota bacterium]
MTRSFVRSTVAALGLGCLIGFLGGDARADAVAMPPAVTCCKIPNQPFGMATFDITVCNITQFPAAYTYQVTSPAPGVFVEPNFAVTTPVIQPGKCMTFQISVFCPQPGPLDPLSVPLVATVQNLSSQLIVQAQGNATFVNQVKAKPAGDGFELIVDPVAGPFVIPVPTPVTFLNDTLSPIGLDLTFDGLGVIAPPPPISIAVPPGGSSIELIPQAVLPEGAAPSAGAGATEGPIPVPAPLPPDFGYLVIKWDGDGDGIPEPHASVRYRLLPVPPPTCPTDLNGDGITNGADITQILNAFGQICP